ncbi:mucin-associated surface protein [Trypanosoma cruzi cruzi]|uniref:Mucin-associated surface protein (MASP) n=1 Tax=Trypanosoma cruzi TaxID=5693 RepID=A0A2V2W4K0_TRYCR|nr:mucin-associated surface protein [Trypanosoma cruzi cruzi]PWV03285.1 Mucin-associated surface protein (MASP) [Trypanosoma cruzi]
MAMMMTGRVLLVCALCVLWCGAGGGKCTEVVKAPAGGAGGGSGGKDVVETTETSAPGPDASHSPTDVPRVNQSTETSEVKSLGGNGDNVDQQEDVVTVVGGETNKNPSGRLEKTVINDPGKENTEAPLQDVGQKEIQLPKSQVNVPQPQPPSAPQPKPSSSENSEGVGENSRGGAVQSPLGAENKGNEDPKNPREEDSLKSPGEESESSEQVQTTVQNTVPPEHKTQNEVLTPEQKTNESQSTDTSTNLPEPQKENKEYPASMEGTAQSTSTGSQEQEAEPSTSEEPSPFEEEQSTGTKTTEDARTPDTAATEKRQSVNNYTTTPGDSDGSTAVSHATSPLLLLVVVAFAAAVVAA